ncbi:alpha/beta hydrolase [Demequina aurantiaca]|uniref:alpha/beta hydrolase n=1 Tax=Demequina aurantiaca TaxID=676200 RepID=UPI003D3429A5
MTTFALIHGMYMNSSSWDPWAERIRAAGHDVVVPEWPGRVADPAQARAVVHPDLRALDYTGVVKAVRSQLTHKEDLVLVGHSIGGLVVQSLLADGVGAAGVALSPAPPTGMLSLRPDFLRANLPHTAFFIRSRPLEMDADRWSYCFGNTLPREQSDALWAQICVPEARGIPVGSLTGQAKISKASINAPLLVVGAEHDHLIPPSLSRRVAKRYSAEYRERAGAAHLLCSEPGWESLADEVLKWGVQTVES